MSNRSPDVSVAGVRVSPDHFIDNQRVPSIATFEVVSPIDERMVARVSAGGAGEIDAAVRAAERAFPSWAALGAGGRAPILRRLSELMEDRVEDLAAVETTVNGSLLEAGRLRVMKRAAYNIRYFADQMERLDGEQWDTPDGRAHNRVVYAPAGVTAVITPWNAPLMLATWKVGPALAVGNTVVLKPPEWAPLTASLLADLAAEALPPGVLNIVQGIGEEAGAALAAHPGVRRIAFTGSTDTARLIGESAARNLVPVSFELGGKSPLIVFADADLDLAVQVALDQYDNAGQVCLAGTRLLVEAPVHDVFLERFVAGARALRQGDPREPTTRIGPLITREHLERVAGYVKRAKAAGARLVFGGRVAPTLGGLYYEPTLFTDVPAGAEILMSEVFGPVLTLQTFRREAEAIQLANDTCYGLAGVVLTRDQARANRVADALVAGTVWLNCFYVRDLAAPFGGARWSGIGREGGRWGVEFYCDVKNVVYRTGTFATVPGVPIA